KYLIPPEVAGRALDLIRANPHVVRATRRREFSGMISRGERYVAFMGIGVEPEHDLDFSRHTTLRAGAPLSPDDPYGVLAGRGLAEKFGGTPGTLMTLMTNAETGALNAVDARLRGLFNRELDVIKLIIGTIVILGIGNTIGMSVLERHVELATLRALGLRSRAIGLLLFTEALLTGLIGGLMGVAIGIVIARVVTAL